MLAPLKEKRGEKRGAVKSFIANHNRIQSTAFHLLNIQSWLSSLLQHNQSFNLSTKTFDICLIPLDMFMTCNIITTKCQKILCVNNNILVSNCLSCHCQCHGAKMFVSTSTQISRETVLWSGSSPYNRLPWHYFTQTLKQPAPHHTKINYYTPLI